MDEKTTLRILNETINRKMGLPKEIVRTPSLAAGDLVVLYALLTEDRSLTQSEIARFLFRRVRRSIPLFRKCSRREQEQFSGLLIKFGDAIEQETALQKKAKNLSQKSRSGQNPAGAFTGR